MARSNYNFLETNNVPIKHWTKGVSVEPEALEQMKRVASMPFAFKHVSGMPDIHVGKGATVGSVIATKGAIVPAAVGVDLGCGMIAYRTTLRADQLPDGLAIIRSAIEAAVPHGRTDNGGVNDKGGFSESPKGHLNRWQNLSTRYDQIIQKHPKAKAFNTLSHMGTLGGGNHFIELCLDEDQQVWIMIHSGSRGAGNRIGAYFIDKAKEEMERYFIGSYLPDKDLSYLVEHTELFDDYVNAVQWAQDYALENRLAMMDATIKAIQPYLPPFSITEDAVNCHHNYIARENHYKNNVWVTRKGAVRAREGDLGIIPGSMGARSYIVRGKGNKDSFCSCSHGAGRTMSRNQARKEISLEQHKAAMKGIEARLDNDIIDESPAAYKDIEAVMKAQDDLVDIVYTLRQIVNVKG